MKPPPFLLGAALLFWGWQSGLFLPGVLLAVILEGTRVFQARWDFSDDDFRRIWTFCTLLLFGAALYAFSANGGPASVGFLWNGGNSGNPQVATTAGARAAATVIRWLPLIFYPFLLVQTYSTREAVPLTTISLILQRRWKQAKKSGQPAPGGRGFNVGYPYFCMTLLAASFHPADDNTFFWGFCGLLTWALWTHRSRRFGWAVWLGLLLVVAGGGYFGQRGIGQLQQYLTNLNPQWLAGIMKRPDHASQSRTALGALGRIKNSSRIVIRATPAAPEQAPQYLREASYRLYSRQTWLAGSSRDDFKQVYEDTPGDWTLLPEKRSNTTLQIACYLEGYEENSPVGLLPLPPGTTRLEKLFAYNLTRSSAGAVRAYGPGLVVFDARYGPGETIDAPPGWGTQENQGTQRLLAENAGWHRRRNADSGPRSGPPRRSWRNESASPPVFPGFGATLIVSTNEDLDVPLVEQAALDAAIGELQLEDQRLPQVLRAVARFFEGKFKYQTWQVPPRGDSPDDTPLSRFLLETRAGHCEYFATATALLLRRLGIPTRYATGYVLHEKSGAGYVVRMSDAHAWTLVWDEDQKIWLDFDTTPADWTATERKGWSPFLWVSDAWSRLWFEFSKFRNGQSKVRQYLVWVVVPGLALLLYQIVFQRGRRRTTGRAVEAAFINWPGLDSDFYRLEQRLAEHGVPRGPAEPVQDWLRRALRLPELASLRVPLEEVVHLHYRHRFDPLGLNATDRAALQRETARCLERLAQLPESPPPEQAEV